MEKLPFELVEQICKYFCLHCADHPPLNCKGWPRTALKFDTPEGWANQRVLASLSLVCRRFHAIAQPILCHCYTNTKAIKAFYWSGRSGHRHCTPEIKFIQSLARNPLHRHHVKTLALDISPFLSGGRYTEGAPSPWLAPARYIAPKEPDAAVPEPRVKAMRNSIKKDTRYLVDFALALTPNLEEFTLLHARPAPCLEKHLPNLKKLTLHQCLFYRVRPVAFAAWLILAPNLEALSLVSPGCCRPPNLSYDSQWPDISHKLRHLCTDDVDLPILGRLLSVCSEVEDLVCSVNPWLNHSGDGDAWTETSNPIRRSLRRLSYLATVPYPYSYCSTITDPEDASGEPAARGGGGFNMIRDCEPLNLQGFESLQDLEIEQVLLYRLGATQPHQSLVNVLPPSIRSLRLTHALGLQEMSQAFAGLADSAQRGGFADLKRVQIDPSFSSDLTMKNLLREILRPAGIEVLFGESHVSCVRP